MTKQEFDEMAALVVRLRRQVEIEQSRATHESRERHALVLQLSAHVDALKQSNAQCSKLLVQNEQLHSELVEVRAALASAIEQRDSLRRTLYEWEHADTKPHECVSTDDVADHVVPPILPLCMTCHGCGFPLRQYGRVFECPNQLCNRINTGALGSLSISPAYGPCKSATPVRHE